MRECQSTVSELVAPTHMWYWSPQGCLAWLEADEPVHTLSVRACWCILASVLSQSSSQDKISAHTWRVIQTDWPICLTPSVSGERLSRTEPSASRMDPSPLRSPKSQRRV